MLKLIFADGLAFIGEIDVSSLSSEIRTSNPFDFKKSCWNCSALFRLFKSLEDGMSRLLNASKWYKIR